MNTVADLTNSELDAAYAASWQLGDEQAAAFYGVEILSRLQNPWSFIRGVVGSPTFPLFDDIANKRGSFSQVNSAQESIAVAAIDLKNQAVKAVSFGVGGVVLVGLLAVGVYAYAKSRK